jgi:hypothetical protein
MIIIVDFDGTLALGNKSHITLSEPNYELINKLHKVKKELGAYIKIVTARGAKNNLTKEEKEQRYLHLIEKFCKLYNIPYDEISFNKEYADLYIDDMTISQFDDFDPLKSKFTHNNIIFTTNTVIKKTQNSLFEKQWYELASQYFDVPKILFCNDDTIITQRIYNHEDTTIEDCISILNKFKNLQIPNFDHNTYINNIKPIKYCSQNTLHIIDYIKSQILLPTFFHGDFYRQNLIKTKDKIFMIDSNYKYIFGNYLTDAAKLYFATVAYDKNIEEANKIAEAFGNEVIYYSIIEGLRVCKYNPNYISIVNNIAETVTV